MSQELPDRPLSPEHLSASSAEAEALALRQLIQRHDYLYHSAGAPEISDAAYDRLFDRLKALEEAFPELVTEDSPTRRVGAPPRGDLPALEHTAPMLSLDSTGQEAEVRRFDERIRGATGRNSVEYLLEPKLDGVSIEIVYERGVLTQAVTRGDGWKGEGVTENIRTIPSVPLRLWSGEAPAPAFLSVRGEVLMKLSAFEALNQSLLERGEEPYANPRNATSGAVRQLDSGVTARRPLDCFAYDVLDVRGPSFRTDLAALEALRAWGFRIPDRARLARGVNEILEYHAGFRKDRDDLDYEIDGIVIKLNDLDERVDMGSTSHHPRWALAYKFEPRKEVTRIDRIAVQVGRTGVLTPVALLLPVEVGGVTVSRASLHNREELDRKDIREGDLVRVHRAGDVIPQVVEVLEEEGAERSRPFRVPESCPNCGTPVRVSGPFTLCPNRFGCSAQLKGRLVHFASRNGLDIEGLGSETASALVEKGLVQELADLFELSAAKLEELPGFAAKSAESLVASIQARRSTELRRFLFGLGIPGVGVSVARDLATHFGAFAAVLEADVEALQTIHGIGAKMADQIRSFLHDPRTRASVRALFARMEALTVPTPSAAPRPWEGQRFVFTGTLESMPRSRAKQIVEAAGGRAGSAVSKETDLLVEGTGGGAKGARARELGIPIWTEEDFLDRIEALGLES